MDKDSQLALIRHGVETWNNWNIKSSGSQKIDLSETDLSGADLREANLRNANLSQTIFSSADLSGADLSGADLSGADLSKTTLIKTNLSGANLSGAEFSQAKLSSADFNYTGLAEVNFSGANLSEATLSNVNLNGTDLSRVNLSGANLSVAILSHSDLSGADLSGANLSLAKLIKSSFIGSNLNGASLSYSDLSQANLSKTQLSRTDLSGANLGGTDLSEADLSGGDLSGAYLNHVTLCGANLNCVNLSGADLSNVDLSGADLSSADLSRAQLLGASFSNAKLTGACIEDWHIGDSTKLDNIACDYIFRTTENDGKFSGRLPVDENSFFAEGEFTQRFQILAQALETIDLTFSKGIDWQAFFQSFQEVRALYSDETISIQAIERKDQYAFVVRLETSAEVEQRGEIESTTKQLYVENKKLSTLNTSLNETVRLLAESQLIMAKRQGNRIINHGSMTGVVGGNQDLSNSSSSINNAKEFDESGSTRWTMHIAVIGLFITGLTLVATFTVPEVRCLAGLDSGTSCSSQKHPQAK